MAAVFKFKADGSQYARGLNQMRGQTQKFTTSVKGMVAGAFAGVSIAGFKNLLDNIVEMRRASERLGIGVEMFQKLSYAAKQTGSDSERLADAIKDCLFVRIPGDCPFRLQMAESGVHSLCNGCLQALH